MKILKEYKIELILIGVSLTLLYSIFKNEIQHLVLYIGVLL